ncbi:MAG TPA: alpha-isopropylmalate synthase regulatory domain-containing protein, partial [Gemmatimonadaceae bacterium]|nr:alpha-isopropylmalate synthase regulatory domain-containing protein [Gemmatimonadaceae bacterium]
VVMSLHTRAGVFGAGTGIATGEIARASRLVAACTGVRVPPNKAVVGANAFAHEAGIHQAGVLEHRGTYEIIHAESVGMRGGVLVLGKHSGRHAFRAALRRTGVDPSEEELTRMFERFKALADQQKSVGAHELQQLLADEARGAGRPAGAFRLERVQVVCGTAGTPTALVCLQGGSDGDATRTECAEGAGAVDAVCRALDRAVGVRAELVELTTDVLPGAHGTVCEVLVRVRERGCDGDEGEASVATGHAMHADIILATAQAYLAALNRLSTARRAHAADAAMGELVAGSAA